MEPIFLVTVAALMMVTMPMTTNGKQQIHALGNQQGRRKHQHGDAQQDTEYAEHKTDAESSVADRADDAENTVDHHQNNDEIACVHKGEQRREHTGEAESHKQDAQNDE